MNAAQAQSAGLTPDLAKSLLEADLANIVELVNSGSPLSARHRAVLEEVARKAPATPSAPAAATPPPAELNLESTPSAPAPAEPLVLSSPAEIIPLEAIPDPGAYRHTYRIYAERLDVSERTVKLWVKEGKEHNPPKLPPFDDPELLPSWWHAIKTNRPPTSLLAAAEAARRARVGTGKPTTNTSTGAGNGQAQTAAPVISAPAAPQQPPEPLAVGFAASLERVRFAEAEANRRYLAEFNRAEAERDESRIARLRREWSELSEQLRHLEKAAPDVLGKSGEMLVKAEVGRLLGKLHGPIVSGFRTLWNRLEAKVGPNSTLEAARPAYKGELEKLLARLCQSEFAPAADLDTQAPT